jgi:hypothetical protein
MASSRRWWMLAFSAISLVCEIFHWGAAENLQPLLRGKGDAQLAHGQLLVDNRRHRLAARDLGGQQLALPSQVVAVGTPRVVNDDGDRVQAEAELPVKQDSLQPLQVLG